jgi:hypothetical protein
VFDLHGYFGNYNRIKAIGRTAFEGFTTEFEQDTLILGSRHWYPPSASI